MASSYSTDLKLELMVTGENSGTWGDKTNTNLNLLQQAIAGYQAIALTSTNTTLAMSNATISDARNAVIKFTGTIAANTTIFVDSGIEKTYTIENATVGAFTLALNQVGGASVIWAATDKSVKQIYLNGTDAVDTGLISATGVATLTNKTLTTPTLTSPIIDVIDDSNGNEEIKFTTTASAVNELTVANAATGNAPEISSTGDDTNIDIKITPKGTGKVVLDGIKYPATDGSAGQVLSTDGSGNLSFTTIESSPTNLQTSLPLASGKSTTVRTAVSISKGTGEVGAYPVLNTLSSTIYVNGTTFTVYPSTDGTTGIMNTSVSPSQIFFRGVYTPHNGTPVIGNTSVVYSTPGRSYGTQQSTFASIKPFNSASFLIQVTGYSIDGEQGQQSRGNGYKGFTVNTSGLLTTTNEQGFGSGGDGNAVANNSIAMRGTESGQSPSILTLASVTQLTNTGDTTDVIRMNTGGNIMDYGFINNNIYFPTNTSCIFTTVSATTSGAAFTTPVTLSIAANVYNNTITWSKIGNLRWMANYQNATTLARELAVYDVNATTFVYTSVHSTTASYTGTWKFLGSQTDYIDASYNATIAVTQYSAGTGYNVNTLGVTASGIITGFNVGTPIGTAGLAYTNYYNNGNVFLDTNSSAQAVLQFYQTSMTYRDLFINAAATDLFNYAGIAAANDSTTPVNVIQGGSIGGYTGLAIGNDIYTNFDGTLTTSNTGIKVGYALTSTQILMSEVVI
jgi:hypothetical protein